MKSEKWKTKIQTVRNGLFISPVFVVMVLIVSGIILCYTAFFKHAVAILEKDIQKQSVTFLNNISKEFSDAVLGGERICKRLYFDQQIRYYLDKEEISAQDEQVAVIQELMHSEMIRGSGIHSVYVYYQKQNRLITEEGVFLPEDYTNNAWLDYGNMDFGARTVTPVWTAVEYEDGNKILTDVVSVIRCFPVYTTDNIGAVVVNVDIGSTADTMTYLDKNEQTTTLMLNPVGIVQKSGSGTYDRGSITNILGSELDVTQINGQEVIFKEEPVKLYASEETYFDWRIIQIYPIWNMQARYHILWQYFYTALVLGILGILVLLFFYFRLRRANLINGRPVRKAIDIIDRDNRMMLRGLFDMALHTEIPLQDHRRREYAGMGFPMQDYYVLLVKLKERGSASKTDARDKETSGDGAPGAGELSGEKIAEMINQGISHYTFGYCINSRAHEFIVIVHLPEKKEEQAPETDLKTLCEYVQQLFKDSCQCNVGIAAGCFAAGFEDLKASLETARAMDKAVWMKSGDCIVYHEEKSTLPVPYCYNGELENRLSENLRNGNEQAALLDLRAFLEELKSGNRFCPENVYRGMLQLTCAIYQTVQSLYDPRKLTSQEMEMFLADPLGLFAGLESCQAVQKWLGGIIREVSDWLWEIRGTAASENMIPDVKAYIAQNYSKGLTLSQTAEEFQVSESYLSRTFKQKTGENFLTYLNKYRINMAKKIMLQDRTVNISDVSNMVGFENVQTFIRVFKKTEGGVTPGTYRELYYKNSVEKEGKA